MKRLNQLIVNALAGGLLCATAVANAQTTYEAEMATWSSAVVEVEHAGFTGSGYVNTANTADVWIEFSVNAVAAGNYRAVVTYGNGTAFDRPVDLLVNGTAAVSGLPFPSTGSWPNWSTLNAEFSLDAGANSIRLVATGSSGLANIDRLELVSLDQGNSAPVVDVPIRDYTLPHTSRPTFLNLDTVFSDPDGDSLSYSLESVPAEDSAVFLDQGVLTIAAYYVGTTTNTVTADDGRGGVTTETFTVTVTPNNTAPYVVEPIRDYTYPKGTRPNFVNLDWVFEDAEGDTLSYSIESTPAELSTVGLENGVLTIASDIAGVVTHTVTADDGKGGIATETFVVTVEDVVGDFEFLREAEEAYWSAGYAEDEHAGYSFLGYVNTPNTAGQWLSFEIDLPQSSTYTLQVRYANGGSTNRNVEVLVDGVVQVASLDFPPTGSWSTWQQAQVSLNLPVGLNEIRLNALTNQGAANIDQYYVFGGTAGGQ